MKTDEQLKKENPELYRVAREKGTEAPRIGKYVYTKDDGMYHCAVCDATLFSSDTKFDSHSGWPSFTDPVSKEAVRIVSDDSHGMQRSEVVCNNCDAHLGHVFPDGPERENGVGRCNRYCLNSVSLELQGK